MALDKIWLALDIAEKAGVPITLRAEDLRPVVEAIERLQAENARLRAALEQVEWIHTRPMDAFIYCPWCNGGPQDGHAPDCPRQAALA